MSVAFAEVRINDIVPMLLDTVGGPEFQTNIIVVQSGYEQRNKNWSQSRGSWNLGERVVDSTEKAALIAFFNARNGKFQGFRFKDWADYAADYTQGLLGTTGAGTGLDTYQLYKNYSSGGTSFQKKIVKPVSPTVAVKLNGSVIAVSTDYTTGIVTLSPTTTKTITAITQASSGVVTTSAAHGLTTGNVVFISGVVGMTQVNNQFYTIGVLNSVQFQLNVSTSGYSAYVSGGTVSIYPQAADTLTWSGEFDLPARFETDNLQYRLEQIINNLTPYFYLMSLPILEIRI